MQIIHSLTTVRISNDQTVDIPTYFISLPLKRNGNIWIDEKGNSVSPNEYLKKQMQLNGFSEIDPSNQKYYQLSKSSGSWEICGMQDNQILFASVIENREQVLSKDQLDWFLKALESGLLIDNFALIEIEC